MLFLTLGLILTPSAGTGHAAGIPGARKPLVILVEAEYPGASAQVVADTVAAPIEQQVNGVENMLHLRSRCTNDGKYVLEVTFKSGSDPAIHQVLVQNRVALAMPLLPLEVKRRDITVRKQQPGVLLIAALTSPDGRHNTAYLDVYARRRIKNEVLQLKGVGGVDQVNETNLDEKPATVLSVHALGGVDAKETGERVRTKLKQIGKDLPRSLRLEVIYNAGKVDSDPLLLNIDLPAAASSQRRQRILEECARRVRKVKEVRQVATLSRNPFQPFDSRPCLLVSPVERRNLDRGRLIETCVTELQAVKGVQAQLGPLATNSKVGRVRFSIDLAVCGPEEAGVRKMARKLAERLRASKKLRDLWCSRDTDPVKQLQVTIDRDRAAKHDVTIKDIHTALEAHQSTDGNMEKQVEDLKELKLRNSSGAMVALKDFARVRLIDAPQVIDRLDMLPMVSLTANLADGVAFGPARKLCVSVAEEVRKELRLPAAYKLVWLP